MKIPKIITSKGKQFILVKEYPNFIMYKDMLTGVKECFNKQELGILKKTGRITNISPEKVKR